MSAQTHYHIVSRVEYTGAEWFGVMDWRGRVANSIWYSREGAERLMDRLLTQHSDYLVVLVDGRSKVVNALNDVRLREMLVDELRPMGYDMSYVQSIERQS